MKIWCYDDAHRWGQDVVSVAQARGHTAKLFESVREPDEGYVFFHMHGHPAVRNYHKRMMAQFATNPRLKLIPSYRLSVLYDDKLEQLRQLPQYMPETRLMCTPNMAKDYLDSQPVFPLVSKSSKGSGVRIIRSVDDARREIKLAFSDLGIRNRFGIMEHGFLYWQQHVGEHDHTMRILCLGEQRLIARRGSQKDIDRPLSCVRDLDEECLEALEFANSIVTEQKFNFCGLDIIQTAEGWRLLKLGVGWQVRQYDDCVFVPDQQSRKGTAVWSVLVEEIEKGHLD